MSKDETSQIKGWRRLPLDLYIMVSDTGLVSFGANEPRNLSVTGLSLQEALNEFVTFAEDCEGLGRPFAALAGVKLR